jgi:hypothetical protein
MGHANKARSNVSVDSNFDGVDSLLQVDEDATESIGNTFANDDDDDDEESISISLLEDPTFVSGRKLKTTMDASPQLPQRRSDEAVQIPATSGRKQDQSPRIPVYCLHSSDDLSFAKASPRLLPNRWAAAQKTCKSFEEATCPPPRLPGRKDTSSSTMSDISMSDWSFSSQSEYDTRLVKIPELSRCNDRAPKTPIPQSRTTRSRRMSSNSKEPVQSPYHEKKRSLSPPPREARLVQQLAQPNRSTVIDRDLLGSRHIVDKDLSDRDLFGSLHQRSSLRRSLSDSFGALMYNSPLHGSFAEDC